MSNETVDNYPHALEFVPDCFKTQNEDVNTYLSAILCAPEYYRTRNMSVKAANTRPFVFDSAPDLYKTQFLIILLC